MKVIFDIEEAKRIIDSLSKKMEILKNNNQNMELEISNLSIYWNSESGEVYRNKITNLNSLINSNLEECKLLIELLSFISGIYNEAKQNVLAKASKLRGS